MIRSPIFLFRQNSGSICLQYSIVWMAICEDDWENLWCAEMPEEFVTAGDGIEIDGLTPLEDLPMEQQVRIKNELAALPEEYLDVLRN